MTERKSIRLIRKLIKTVRYYTKPDLCNRRKCTCEICVLLRRAEKHVRLLQGTEKVKKAGYTR